MVLTLKVNVEEGLPDHPFKSAGRRRGTRGEAGLFNICHGVARRASQYQRRLAEKTAETPAVGPRRGRNSKTPANPQASTST